MTSTKNVDPQNLMQRDAIEWGKTMEFTSAAQINGKWKATEWMMNVTDNR